MAAKPNPDSPDRYYPSLEAFVETEPRSAIGELYETPKKELSSARGTKAAAAKKALAAIERTEDLLQYLFDVKDRMTVEGAGKPRK